MIRSTSILSFAVLFLTVSPLLGQTAQPNSVNTNNASGVMPYVPYAGARENINLPTGNVNVQVPLISLPGRNGHDLNLSMTYDSKIWQLSGFWDEFSGFIYEWYAIGGPGNGTDPGWLGQVGWRLNVPGLTWTSACHQSPGQSFGREYDSDFILALPDGSRHHFKNKDNTKTRPQGCEMGTPNNTPQYDVPVTDSEDGSYIRLDTSPSAYSVAHLKDGTSIWFYSTSTEIVDSNGNIIRYNFTNGMLSSIVDTLGRTITISRDGGGLGKITSLAYKDSTGVARTISFAYVSQTLAPTFSNPTSGPGSYNYWMVSSVTLPNSRSFSFLYNNFGELTKITYPTGGYTRYTFGTYQAWHQVSLGDTDGDFREVTAKYVCGNFSGTCSPSEEVATTYTPTVTGTYSNNSAQSVMDPLGNKTAYTFTYEVMPGSNDYFPVASPRELTHTQYQGTTTVLRTVQTDYVLTWNERLPIRATTTLENGMVSKVEWDYDTYTFINRNGFSSTKTIDNVKEQREYDYGSLTTPKRKTKTFYLKINPVNSQNYNATTIFTLDRKSREEVYDSSSGTDVLKGQTRYEFDSYTEGITASGAVQRKSGYGTTYTTRGNMTFAERWRNTDGAWLGTRNQYDDSGNARKVTDPLGHATTFSYADSWGNITCVPSGGNAAAYVTSVTNALGQVSSSTYNTCSGTVASSTDPNNQATTYSYDLLNRLTQANRPNTGQTTITYNEASLPLSFTATTKITSSLDLVNSTTVDGLGRAVQSRLDSDPEGIVYSDSTYDALGRKAAVSNPYRSMSESTYGTTAYNYDALSRVTKVIPPDGTDIANNVSTVYDGNCTTVTDQAGKKRKSCADALGRLIQVFEPDAAGSFLYETAYQYDTLDNLTRVDQKGNDANSANWRTRTFTYDSLSQLLTASNPESGTINYTYDSDGNLATKVAPAPTQIGPATVTTTYFYDALHRLTGKTYSNGDPAVSYFYDQAAYNGLSIANGKGRRTGMSDSSGATAWSYDSEGRALTERRTISGFTKVISYTYNLDGSLASLTYPSGRIVNYAYNAAARPLSAIDTANGINYATAATYAPHGALAGVKYGVTGTFTGIVTSNTYNPRLQPVVLSAASPSQTVLSFSYGFGLGTANNGNVLTIQNNRDLDRTQSFIYDQLNRIATAQSSANSGGNCWGESFTYDIWANLLNRGTTKTDPSCQYEPLSVAATTKNQISGCYDAAGNLLGETSCSAYAYDAENRMTASAAGGLYFYDGDGERVKKSTGTIYWGLASNEPLAESDLSGTLSKEFIFFGGKRMARLDLPGGAVHYYFSDHLGSSNVVTSATGATIEEESDFYPFGGERVLTDLLPDQRYKFTGK